MLSDGLIGALIGGGATVLVSAITNYFVVKNLAKQQAHDAKQKSEDRKLAMRRDVYLQYVEDVHAVFEFLGDLQSRLISDDDASPFHVFQKSSGKVWLIADKKNALLSRELTDVLSEAVFACIASSIDIRLAYGHYEELKRRAIAARAEAAEAEAAMKRANRETSAQADLQFLVHDYVEKNGWEIATAKAFDEAFAESGPLRHEYSTVMSAELKPVTTLFVKLVNGLREEIGLEADEDAFIKVLREQERRSELAMQRMGVFVRSVAKNAERVKDA